MKYMAPAIETVSVNIESLMAAASITSIDGDTGIGIGSGTTPATGQSTWEGDDIWGSFDEE